MDINELRSAITLVSLLVFAGIIAWACWPGNRAKFEAAAHLPFMGEESQS